MNLFLSCFLFILIGDLESVYYIGVNVLSWSDVILIRVLSNSFLLFQPKNHTALSLLIFSFSYLSSSVFFLKIPIDFFFFLLARVSKLIPRLSLLKFFFSFYFFCFSFSFLSLSEVFRRVKSVVNPRPWSRVLLTNSTHTITSSSFVCLIRLRFYFPCLVFFLFVFSSSGSGGVKLAANAPSSLVLSFSRLLITRA